MAGEVTPQGEGARSLHLRQLRVQWQIVTLQVLATLALVWMYLEVVSTYVVGSIDHTQLFDTLETCLLYTSPSPRDRQKSRMPSSA